MDYNSVTIQKIINKNQFFGTRFIIENGKITGTENKKLQATAIALEDTSK